MKHVGRRKIYLYGFSIMFVLLLAVGICGVTPRSDASAYGAGSLLLVYTFFYNFTIGSVGYTLISEIPSTRLKNSTISLARCAYNVVRTHSRRH
jgi:MFS transporter, SP family, general alpha glucoside:H+ symporter